MYYYYQYILANKSLKTFNVWDYSQEIITALKLTYKNHLISVDFSDSYYGFWLDRPKGQYEHSPVGKSIASSVSDFNNNKSIYNYTSCQGTHGTSTQIFKEDTSKSKIQSTL